MAKAFTSYDLPFDFGDEPLSSSKDPVDTNDVVTKPNPGVVGKPQSTATDSKLESLTRALLDRFWSGGISNPLAAVEQVTYLLFMKQIEQIDLSSEKAAKLTGDAYVSRFSGEFFLPEDRERTQPIDKATLRWSHFKQMRPDLMLQHVQQRVFPFIKTLSGEVSAFSRHMANAVFSIPSSNLLQRAVSDIDDIYLEIEREGREGGHLFQDVLGDIYERLLNELSSAGRNGQFRTPRHIIKLLTELVNPKLGDRICDPACGTGGFLLDAYQYIVTQLSRQQDAADTSWVPDADGFIRSCRGEVLTAETKGLLSSCLSGRDKDTTMVRLALMNLMLHGIDNPHVDYADALGKGFKEENKYAIVMANPPFSGSLDKADLGENLQLGTTKTEILFIELIYQLLQAGGTAGIIVPTGVLFGTKTAHVQARRRLIEQGELKAVISLPSGVFRPYAGVATAILVFTRAGRTTQTWFYDVHNDGFSLDDQRERVDGSELPDVLAQWHARESHGPGDRKANHFFVPVQELRDNDYNLSFNCYREVVVEEPVYEDPRVILKQMMEAEEDYMENLRELEKLLG